MFCFLKNNMDTSWIQPDVNVEPHSSKQVGQGWTGQSWTSTADHGPDTAVQCKGQHTGMPEQLLDKVDHVTQETVPVNIVMDEEKKKTQKQSILYLQKI